MAPFEDSPRPTKKRKTTTMPHLSPAAQHPLPFSTRAFRAVKDVVLGRTAQHSDNTSGEDELASTTAQNGMIGGLRKSLSTLEMWKMARSQNGSTRGMGVSETNSPATTINGTNTPTMGKMRRDAQDEESGGGDCASEHTPSKKAERSNGIASSRKGKKYRTEIQINVDGEEDDGDPMQVTTPSSLRRSTRLNTSGPAVEIEGTPKRFPVDSTPRTRGKRPPDTSMKEANITTLKRRPLSTQLGKQRAKSPEEEESDLGFKAMGLPRSTKQSSEERGCSSTDSDPAESGVIRGDTSTPLKRPGRALNGRPSKQRRISKVHDQIDDMDMQVSLRDATASLQKILQDMTTEGLADFKSEILSGLAGRRRLPLVNLEYEYQKVHQIIEQTVLAGEGNSMLVIGARGCAKTTLVETGVSDFLTNHREDFHVVRLNGFVHTDDKLALREIWRQLGREMEVEDDATTGRTNYADTLTSLLALLSHSSEGVDDDAPATAKSVIFILDEFELFTSHSRQTLLYNLFDVAQSRNAPIAVLGLTTKIDVVESLEKRVKSRFGQRYVHLSLPRTFAIFSSICKAALIPPAASVLFGTKLTDDSFCTGRVTVPDLRAAWVTYVDSLFSEPVVLMHLRSIYALSKSVPTFLSSCLYPISNLSPSSIPTAQSFLSPSTSLGPPDSKLHLLPSLSDLALSLLIATARLDIILSTDICNFDMAYEEYVNLASRVKMQTSASGQLAVGGGGGRVWGRAVAKGEWERLVALELMLPATGGTIAGRGKGEQARMWRVDVGLEEIGGSVKMGAVMARWCREI